MTNTNYGKLTAWIIAVWFLFSLIGSTFHLFLNAPNQPPLPILLAVLVPVAVFAVWYLGSKPFRDFVLSLDPRTLTMVQGWRIAGLAFVVLYTYKILPGVFALPAGWGDIFIGVTAIPVALSFGSQRRRTGFILWQFLGVLDLVSAPALGASAGFLQPQNPISMQPMTVLPLSIIPTFGVPLFLILHIICIAQARRWPARSYSRATKQAGLSAA
jgi:hypothetical protein